MLFIYSRYCCNGILLIMLLVMGCAGYAYLVDSRRAPDSPKKRNYHPASVFLAPFTFPLLLFASISIFILRALTYGVFLILFTIALIAFRKPFLLAWLRKAANAIGSGLLEANTLLLKLFLRPWTNEPATT